jgi:uncharacterized surface protein with fasciclin (FAS1) repeats
MTNFLRVLAVGVLSAGVTGCTQTSSSPVMPSSVADAPASASVSPATRAGEAAPRPATGAQPGTNTIVGIVLAQDEEFDVLQAAVTRAGLVDALNGTTQYTVFAPTDLAFVTTLGVADEAAAIAAVNGLDEQDLKNILLYHVTHGRRNSKSVLGAPRYQMLNGSTLTRTELTGAGIAATDISASNGIVHVINAVLIPSS